MPMSRADISNHIVFAANSHCLQWEEDGNPTSLPLPLPPLFPQCRFLPQHCRTRNPPLTSSLNVGITSATNHHLSQSEQDMKPASSHPLSTSSGLTALALLSPPTTATLGQRMWIPPPHLSLEIMASSPHPSMLISVADKEQVKVSSLLFHFPSPCNVVSTVNVIYFLTTWSIYLWVYPQVPLDTHCWRYTYEYLWPAGFKPTDPGDLWEKILAGLGMDFDKKLPAGKGPGNPGCTCVQP